VSEQKIQIRLLFSDGGAFHTQDLTVPAAVVEDYDRLIDGLREDPEVLKMIYLDLGRIAAAWVEDGE
jgi:hypothetical protein